MDEINGFRCVCPTGRTGARCQECNCRLLFCISVVTGDKTAFDVGISAARLKLSCSLLSVFSRRRRKDLPLFRASVSPRQPLGRGVQQLPLHRRQSGVHKGKTSRLKVVPPHSCSSSLSSMAAWRSSGPGRNLETANILVASRPLASSVLLSGILKKTSWIFLRFQVVCGRRPCRLRPPGRDQRRQSCPAGKACLEHDYLPCFSPPCDDWGVCAMAGPSPRQTTATKCQPNSGHLDNSCGRVTLVFNRDKVPPVRLRLHLQGPGWEISKEAHLTA